MFRKMLRLSIQIFRKGVSRILKKRVKLSAVLSLKKFFTNDRETTAEMDQSDGFIITNLSAKDEALFRKKQGMICSIPDLLENLGYTPLEIKTLCLKSRKMTDKEIAQELALPPENITELLRNIYNRNEVGNFDEWKEKLWM